MIDWSVSLVILYWILGNYLMSDWHLLACLFRKGEIIVPHLWLRVLEPMFSVTAQLEQTKAASPRFRLPKLVGTLITKEKHCIHWNGLTFS